jgi:hypothetical protein
LFYYIFKFKKDITDEKWILGVCDGYKENAKKIVDTLLVIEKNMLKRAKKKMLSLLLK